MNAAHTEGDGIQGFFLSETDTFPPTFPPAMSLTTLHFLQSTDAESIANAATITGWGLRSNFARYAIWALHLMT